jgi:hypothetical protein
MREGYREESARVNFNGGSLRKIKGLRKGNNHLFMSVSQIDLENLEFPNNDIMNVSPKVSLIGNQGKHHLKKLSKGSSGNSRMRTKQET